jgi:3-methyladenine DNA glycosylase AlkC
MATKEEEIQKETWWLNELESLGVSPKVQNELNDIQETSNLAENLKQAFYQAYKEAYNEVELAIKQFFAKLFRYKK